mmetsp:Transcript_18573/g.22720  ORF Transcript_18573/g.22720 Transcript_18573/m.22720 type:complete len:196 (+) Transcript_18573:274-861(+)|eukprot:CAMPEP_0204843038 /NCGR_PEP_ID=MMETSP1346-20131115/47741_1 /ASSEMBLY_ACC=CAM_ASM_000771 /TAXON_ID=215587 /ORGANISM="Aplanochytrium stocchinoi, Strain GSBS06" /LENGTH=195 /DNA_ID=CAMNT_0051982105 /DNA_START=279 /DNA_END=866 /DNA_ORIENTATION=-
MSIRSLNHARKVVERSSAVGTRALTRQSLIAAANTCNVRNFRAVAAPNRILFNELMPGPLRVNPLLTEWELGMPLRHRDAFRDIQTLKMDMIENESSYTVTFDVPGVDKNNVDISIEDKNLTVSVDHKLERSSKDDKEAKVHWRERTYGHVSRTFSLPKNADVNAVEAKQDDGVLTITIKKLSSPEAEVKKITVN